MLYLIFGRDDFQIQEKLNQIKAQFSQENSSDFGILVFDEKVSFEELKNAFEAANFLSPAKLIIIKNFIAKANSEVQKKLARTLEKIPKSIDLIFLEEFKTAQNPIWKRVVAKGKIWQFEPLPNFALLNWIKRRILEKGGQISFEAAKILAFYIGNNLWRQNSEIEKLINFKGKKQIEPEDIEKLVKPEFSPKIFDLIDNIALKNLSKSENILKQLLDSGENPLYIQTMIVYQFRNLIKIKYLADSNLKESEIQKKTKLHPFVVKKSLGQIKNFSLEDLKRIYTKLLEAEIAMKTGAVDQRLALELLALALCR